MMNQVEEYDDDLDQLKDGDDMDSEHKMANGDDKSPNNLIINYLPNSLTDEGLVELFKPYGIITHCKIVRDRTTGASLGYGFVKYQSPEMAIQAVQKMNGMQLERKVLRVSIARPPNKSLARVNVYVAGLPLDYSVDQLRQMFLSYGNPTDVKLLKDPSTGLPRGVGFVAMDSHENAVNAIRALDKSTITQPGTDMKRTLTVRFANPRQTRPMVGQASPYGMPPNYGPLRANNQHMAPSRYNPIYALYDASGFPVPQNAPVQPQPQSNAGVCLFVYNIPPDMAEQNLAHLFAACGSVLSSKVMRDMRTGLSKGYGFVNMMDGQQAQLAITTLNGYKLGNKTISVSLKTATKIKGM